MSSSGRNEAAREDQSCWIVLPSQVERVKRVIQSGDARWCYVGVNAALRARVTATLGLERRLRIGPELTAIAVDAKQPFVDWADGIGAHIPDQRLWWATRFASKSNLQTDFFLSVCAGLLVLSWFRTTGGLPVRIIVVEDVWLASTLITNLGDPRVKTFRFEVSIRRTASRAYWQIREPLTMGFVFLWALAVRAVSLCLAPRWPSCESGKKAVLLYTWLQRRCFPATGGFVDPYSGRLADVLRHAGHDVWRLPPLKASPGLLKRLKTCGEPFLVAGRAVSVADVFGALAAAIHLRPDVRESFRGLDCEILFRREWLRERGHPSLARNVLWSLTLERVARHFKRCGQTVVYPFENQPVEKMLCSAFRQSAPSVRLVGYLMAGIPSLLLSFVLGRAKQNQTPLPDAIVTNGPGAEAALRAAGFHGIDMSVGGAFRFEHVQPAPEQSFPAARSAGNRVVLVLLPITESDAAMFVDELVDALGEPVANGGGGLVSFVLAAHPTMPFERIRPRVRPLPPWMLVSTEPLTNWLLRVDACLFTAPTGSWREPYFAGVPVLKYQCDSLDLDPVDLLGAVILPSCSADDVREKLASLIAAPNRVPADVRKRQLEAVFAPVVESVWWQAVNASGHRC